MIFDLNKNGYNEIVRKSINEIKKPNNSNNTTKQNMKPILIEKGQDHNNRSKYEIDEDGFKTIKRRSTDKKLQESDDDCSSIVGAAPFLRSIWISKLIQGNVISIKRYLNDNNIRVQKITKTSHADSTFKSFKVVILSTDAKAVLRRDFWPVGVKCQVCKDKNNSHIKSRTFLSSLNIKLYICIL